jgi:hypothetical protein
MNTISIVMTGRTVANIKSDSRKQFIFYQYVIKIILSNYLFIYVLTQQPKGKLEINMNIL